MEKSNSWWKLNIDARKGWRIFAGWSCGASILYAGVVYPTLELIAAVMGVAVDTLPEINTAIVDQLILGMLGLAGMRSYEKKSGVDK